MLLQAAACVEPASEYGRPCPCSELACCPSTNSCVYAAACPALTAEPDCASESDGAATVLIDDFEHDDPFASPDVDCSKLWEVFDDRTGGTMTVAPAPLAQDRCNSHVALHVLAQGYSQWGSGVQFALAPQKSDAGGCTRGPFDLVAHGYVGVRFSVRTGAGEERTIRLALNDEHVDPAAGLCSDGPDACNPFYEGVPVTPTWSTVSVYFRDVAQTGYFNGLKVDGGPSLRRAYSIAWDFPSPDAYDVWIDDVRWIVQ